MILGLSCLIIWIGLSLIIYTFFSLFFYQFIYSFASFFFTLFKLPIELMIRNLDFFYLNILFTSKNILLNKSSMF